MFNNVINKLKKRGVEFELGLTNNEVDKIESIYNIILPYELKLFLKTAVPISDGFYNWRNFAPENIKFIKETILSFKNNIIECFDDVEWCPKWGKEPEDIEKRKAKIIEMVNNAPTIIPLYGHRGMAEINVMNNPVFSIVDTDIIYYGKNIINYLEIEFDIKKYDSLNLKNITYIPFWSDLI